MLKHLDNSELSQLLKSCPMGLALSDRKQIITWVNDAFESYLGISAAEITDTNINSLPEDLKQLFTSSSTVHIPANKLHDDQWYKCSQSRLEASDHTMHYFSDVAPLNLLAQQKDQLRNELDEALAIDSVTGMPNIKALFQNLESQISRSRRYNNLLSIIVMKVNKLEELDQALTCDILIPISHLLNDQIRWADIVGKLSDNEFLLVLPETSSEACKNICFNLSKRLESLPMPESLPQDYIISASFGYAEWQKGDDLAKLMLKARKMSEK